MDIFTVRIEDFQYIILSINWVVAIILLFLSYLAAKCISFIYKKTVFKTIRIDEAVIGIGNSYVTIKYDGRIKEIAYKIWVELTTRKIGLEFEEDYDVISEVYASWYNSFQIIRSLLEEVPADRISSAKGLIEVTTKVLNNGLRPHLTKWQAKYLRWYDHALENNKSLSPQELQKQFPEYDVLVNDLKRTNAIMMKYANELKRLIDDSK